MTDFELCRDLMLEFAEATGLAGGASPRRYLWTDAFATCNFLGLHRQSGERRYLDLALELVDQVHHVLGRHRPDDPRRGWISGLPDDEGERHPTRGGLRIGKDLPERKPGEPLDPDLEWDRDGQYFHYLTKWVHALKRVGEETREPRFHAWAVELAEAGHAGFTSVGSARRPGMAWKMSIDLTRPLVPSSGHHDPLDALITYLDLGRDGGGTVLEREIAEAEALCVGTSWTTDDPLGIGGLLTDVARLVRLVAAGAAGRQPLLRELVQDSLTSLRSFDRTGLLALPPGRRLPFRELGLAIGLHAIGRTGTRTSVDTATRARLDELWTWEPLAASIEAAWTNRSAQQGTTWTSHRDINAVMLATSLCPLGFLGEDMPARRGHA